MFQQLRVLLPISMVLAACSTVRTRSPDPDAAPRAAPPPSSIDGEVIGVDRAGADEQLSSSVRLVMRAGGAQPVTVELAPGWYLEEQGLVFARSDRLRVRGQRSVTSDGRPAIVAWEVEKERRVVPLRDQHGRPVWDAGRK